MDRKKEAILGGLGLATAGALYYLYEKGTIFPITNPKPLGTVTPNPNYPGTAKVYQQVQYSTTPQQQTPTPTTVTKPQPIQPTGQTTNSASSGQIVECPSNGAIKTEAGLMPCTPGYKYVDVKGALFEYEYYSIVQEANTNNSLGTLVDLTILDEAFDYIHQQHPDLTTATICYSFVPLGWTKSSSFKPGAVNKINPTGVTNDPVNGFPNMSLCSPGITFQVASPHALQAEPYGSGIAPMIGFGVIGQTVSKDPMFNFPNQAMLSGNSYYINEVLKTNQPQIASFSTGGFPIYVFDFDITNLPLEIFQTYECFPLFKYYHPVILFYPVINNVAMFYDTFRGYPSINLFPPIYQVLTENSPSYSYHLPGISYSFLSLHMYYDAKYSGKPLQYRTVSYTPAYRANIRLVPLSGNVGYNGWALWEI
jgi:hypothetical protein